MWLGEWFLPAAWISLCPLPQGYDPEAKAPFQPKAKQKGRSSTASLVKRKKKVMDQEHRVNAPGWGGLRLRGAPLPASPPLTEPHFSFLPLPQDKVRQSLEQQQKQRKQEKTKSPGAHPSALDRFAR